MFSTIWAPALLTIATMMKPSLAVNPKRGFGFPSSATSVTDLATLSASSELSWLYNWGRTPASTTGLGSGPGSFVPMIWNGVDISSFVDFVISGGYTEILAFNEPDAADQANMLATDAAALWIEYLEPLRSNHGVRLGAPAVTSSETGRQWLRDFITACDGNCNIDFLPLHWYGDSVDLWSQSWYFGQYIWSMHGEFSSLGPVWITEWASTSTDLNDVAAFMNSSMAILDSYDWIERYAWFGGFRTTDTWGLLDTNGKLTNIGKIYTSA
ncbi:Uncharacterised protein family, glycosyl hydrolase catalytic domain [Phaffia rhodozyma]|uniref:Uncharacterized protein family, glycosyl hydrolase catalytic domain n=1 Tax=Phaffia rhodozyma TaxID=264483 RepID=A0A0F7SGW4_PHARH|nr:Uncharacterised protein family, glycosyl hydrolase catalytic domain [Phaffia rhodozyma]